MSEFESYAARIIDDLVPKISESSVVFSLVPEGPSDVKFAVELGLSIMMDKPIIAVVQPGTKIPAKLAQIADAIVDANLNSDEGRAQILDALERLGLTPDEGGE